MQNRTGKWRLRLFALAWFVSSTAHAEGFVFVRNARNPVATVSRAEIRKLFTGQAKQWRSGKVFQGVIGELDSPEFTWLANAILDTRPQERLTKMKQERFRGELKRPIVVKSSE